MCFHLIFGRVSRFHYKKKVQTNILFEMMNIGNEVQQKCRTCLDTTENKFHSLNGKLVKDDQRQSLADFLWEIAKMENFSETAKKLPQQICDSCLRKLKITFSYVMQVQKVNGGIFAVQRWESMSDQTEKSKKSSANITDVKTKNLENMDMEFGHSNFSQAKECFVDCNASFGECYEDPIAILRARKRKCTSDSEHSHESRQYIEEDSRDSITSVHGDIEEKRRNLKDCKNECHKEMKYMLHNLMNIQKQINARVGVVLNTDINLSNHEEEYVQNKNVSEEDIAPRSVHRNPVEILTRESVRSWFPISSIDQALYVERKIQSHGYAKDVIALLKRKDGYSVDDILRFIFKDDLTEQYNLDGRKGKMSLNQFESILNCVRKTFSELPSAEFFKLVRKYVVMCHHRNNQKKYTLRKKLKFSAKKQKNDSQNIPVCDENSMVTHTFETDVMNESDQFCNEIIDESSFASDTQYNDDDVGVISISIPTAESGQYVRRIQTCAGTASSANHLKEIEYWPVTLADSPESVKSYFVSEVPKCTTTTANDNVGGKLQKLSEIPSLFPILTHEKVLEIEENLNDADYVQKVNEHLIILKGYRGDVDKVLRCIFTDRLIANYNFDGHHGRHSINGLRLVSHCLYSIFPEITMMDFSKNVRKYIAMSHNRYKHKKM